MSQSSSSSQSGNVNFGDDPKPAVWIWAIVGLVVVGVVWLMNRK